MTNAVFSSAVILDVVFLILLLVVAAQYARRGFVAGGIQFIGNLLSLVGALFVSNNVSPVIFSMFFENSFLNSIQSSIAAGTSEQNVGNLLEQYAAFLPQNLKDMIVNSASELLASDATGLANQLVEQVVEPLVTPIIAVVVFFVAFALCRFVVGLVVALLTNLNRIPLLGGMNRLLGFAAGLCAGVLDLYLVMCAIWAIIVVTSGSIAWLNDGALSSGVAYQLFNHWNPFY